MSDWKIFEGRLDAKKADRAATQKAKAQRVEELPLPPWRDFVNREKQRSGTYQPPPRAVEVVNAALYLRRPILVTGQPGTGKSSLIYAVAEELGLGAVLTWPINSRSTRVDGLYHYDAVARLRDAQLHLQDTDKPRSADKPVEEIGRFIKLGPLGTAFLPGKRPRALLIDEIDKSDVDLPNDLLHIFEEGSFEIPELVRIATQQPKVKVSVAGSGKAEETAEVEGGRVACETFPFVVITSNGERDLPPAFLRRCLRLDIGYPDSDRLAKIVRAHLGKTDSAALTELIEQFRARQEQGAILATDQLLNTVFMMSKGGVVDEQEMQELKTVLLRELEDR